MQNKFSFLLSIVALIMNSCGGLHLDGGHDIGWGLYVKGCDSLTIEYPMFLYKNEHPVPSNKEVKWETMEVYKDTFRRGVNWIQGWDVTNIEVHVYRQTSKEDVKIFFLYDIIYYAPNYFYPDNSYNYHVLDSLMDIYGVTMPVDQSALTVPITTLYGK